MLNSLGLGFMFTATDLASGVMGKVKGNLQALEKVSGQTLTGMEQGMNKFLTGMSLVAAGATGMVGAFGLADAAGKFETAVAAAGAVSQATAADMTEMKKAAMGMATDLGSSPVEAMNALQTLAAAGYSAKESISLLQPTLELAAGSLGKLSPDQAAGLASQALKAFGIDTRLASVAVDQMLSAVNAFALDAGELPQALGIASRGAQAMNQSLTETIVAVGLVKNIIPGIERGSTAVATSMEKMVDPKVQKKLAGIGVAVQDATGNFRPFLDVVGDMIPALGKMTIAQRGAFLEDTMGTHALAGLTGILAQVETGIKTNTGEVLKGAAALKYLRDQTIDSTGTAKRFSDQMLATYEGQKKLMSAKMDAAMIELGAAFATVLTPALKAVTAAFSGVAIAVGWLPGPLKVVVAVVFLAALAFVALIGAVMAFQAISPLYKTALSAITKQTYAAAASSWSWAAGVWAAIAPFVFWVVLGAIVIGVILAIVNNWWGLRDAIADGCYVIWKSIKGVAKAIGDTFMEVWNWVKDVAVGAFESVKATILGFASSVWDLAKTLFGYYIWPYVQLYKFVSGVFNWLLDLGGAIGRLLAAGFMYAVAKIRNSDFWRFIVNVASAIGDAFTTLWGWIVTGFWTVVDGIKAGVALWWRVQVALFNLIVDGLMWVAARAWEIISAIGGFIGGIATAVGRFIWSILEFSINAIVTTAKGLWFIISTIGWGLGQALIAIFEVVGNVVMGIFGLAYRFVNWVVDGVIGIAKWVGNLVTKIAGFIADLPDWITGGAMKIEAATPGSPQSFAGAAAAAPAPGPNSMPAVAQSEAAAANARPVAVSLNPDDLANAMSKRPVYTVLQLDSEVVATAMSRVDRDHGARAGRPVGAE